MKINICGKGIIPIPRLRCLAPLYQCDVTEAELRLLMKYRQFKVYLCDNGQSINPLNIKEILLAENNKINHPPKVVEPSLSMKSVDAEEKPSVVEIQMETKNDVKEIEEVREITFTEDLSITDSKDIVKDDSENGITPSDVDANNTDEESESTEEEKDAEVSADRTSQNSYYIKKNKRRKNK